MDFDINNKCRVCLGDEEQMHCLFDEFDKGITLRDILANTTRFEVEKDDGLSPYICQNCTTVIVDFYNLKTIYEENENQIRTLLANPELNLIEDTDIKTDEPFEHNSEDNSAEKIEEPLEEANGKGSDFITIKIEAYTDNECSNDDSDSKHDDNSQLYQDEDDAGEYDEITTYPCPQCGTHFLQKEDIGKHLISHHGIPEVDFLIQSNNNRHHPKKCKTCSQQFDSLDEYEKHVETHKKNVCDICGVGFTKKSYLKDHKEIHETEKRHICNYCNKAFKRRTVLIKHKRIHTHPREHICERCGKAFNDRGTLKTHIMLVHDKERNYMCLLCGVKFPLKATLEKHLRRHQNKEREFFCSQCPLGYRDKSSLDRHIFIKHSGQNVKVICNACGKQYTTVGNLSKHQKTCFNIQKRNEEDEVEKSEEEDK